MFNAVNFEQARILICGDVMLDRYWSGDVSRISPEAPVPVVRVSEMISRAGGAANVALNAAALGAHAAVMGVVGDDADAEELKQTLLASDVTPLLINQPHCSTICKLRVVGGHQQLLRMDFEPEAYLTPPLPLESLFSDQLSRVGAVVLSDYAKGTLANVGVLIQLARGQGIPVLVDPKGTDFQRYRGASLITPNRREFEAVVGACSSEAVLVERARRLMTDCELGAVLVTLSEQGMLLVPQAGEALRLPAKAREVFDVTGAGDTVIGVLASALAAQLTLEEAVQLANVAAGLVVSKWGAATVSWNELKQELYAESHTVRATGLLTKDQAVDAVKLAKARGERVVMTNGCFDVLHAGHVQYLQQAKQLGDRLMVLVNSDESVSALKGADRPINPLTERIEVLAALGAVDWVLPFSEKTPQALYAELLPDVLVKGGDYRVEEVAGAAEVLAQGGEVKILSFRPGCSTTATIQKVRSGEVSA